MGKVPSIAISRKLSRSRLSVSPRNGNYKSLPLLSLEIMQYYAIPFFFSLKDRVPKA